MANVISDETMEYVGILAKLELKDRNGSLFVGVQPMRSMA